MATGKKKTKQRTVEGPELIVDDVEETTKAVSFVSMTEKTDKFEMRCKDIDLEGLEPPKVMQLVRRKMRPIKDVEVQRGETDAHAEKIYRKLQA